MQCKCSLSKSPPCQCSPSKNSPECLPIKRPLDKSPPCQCSKIKRALSKGKLPCKFSRKRLIKQPAFSPGYRPNVYVEGPPKYHRRERQILKGSSFFVYHLNTNIPVFFGRESPNRRNRLLQWSIPKEEINVSYLLPIFCNGLQEDKYPYSDLAFMGAIELINLGGEEVVLPLIPDLVWQIRRAFETRVTKCALNGLKVLETMINCSPNVAKALAIGSRPLLMPLRDFRTRNQNIGKEVDSDTRQGINVTFQIDHFLKLLSRYLGKVLYIKYIKPMWPIFDYSEKKYCIDEEIEDF